MFWDGMTQDRDMYNLCYRLTCRSARHICSFTVSPLRGNGTTKMKCEIS